MRSSWPVASLKLPHYALVHLPDWAQKNIFVSVGGSSQALIYYCTVANCVGLSFKITSVWLMTQRKPNQCQRECWFNPLNHLIPASPTPEQIPSHYLFELRNNFLTIVMGASAFWRWNTQLYCPPSKWEVTCARRRSVWGCPAALWLGYLFSSLFLLNSDFGGSC